MPITLSRYLIVLIMMCMLSQSNYAQQAISQGTIHGIVKDFASSLPLPQATISIYRIQDSAIVKYSLNDGRGRFVISGLPSDTGLIAVVSYIGYQQFSKRFRFENDVKDISLGTINLRQEMNTLAEVTIRLPPMIMRGDTIQFNADAFKLKPNAVVGDLLRELPGVIIWGDGKITVNGKTVTRIMVDNKVFFSGDASVITDNLPKGIVDHIDVIPDQKGADTLQNKGTVNMNVVLKKDKKSGLFGKAGYGRGSKDRYEAEAVLNYFNHRSQISLVGATNNVNKSPMNVNEMLLNSGYQVGTINRYLIEPGFNQDGITRQKSAGMVLNQFWNDDIHTLVDLLKLDSRRETADTRITTTVLTDSTLTQESENTGYNLLQSNRGSVTQELEADKFNSIKIKADMEVANSRSYTNGRLNTRSSTGGLLNTAESEKDQHSDYRIVNLSANWNHSIDESNEKRSKEDFVFAYQFHSEDWDSERTEKNYFNALRGTTAQAGYNRYYRDDNNSSHHDLDIDYLSILPLLSVISRTKVTISNSFSINETSSRSGVYDYDVGSSTYSIANPYLTNTANLREISYYTEIRLSRSFYRSYTGRFYQSVVLNTNLRGGIFSQRNRSLKDFQNIQRTYVNFLPYAGITLNSRRVGKFEHVVGMSYTKTVQNPTINQLVPLVDSAQQWLLYIGNPELKQGASHAFELSYNFLTFGDKTYDLKFVVQGGFSKDHLSDSTYYDQQGRQVFFPVTVDGYRYLNYAAALSRSIRGHKKTFTLSLNPTLQLEHRPYYIFGARQLGDNSGLSLPLKISFTAPRISADLSGRMNFNRFRNSESDTRLSSFTHNLSAFAQYAIIPDLMVGSSYRFYANGANGLRTNYFQIWNASVSMKFSRNRLFEAKFSALDLLRQNNGVINQVYGNSVVVGQVMRLPGFFMLSLSYFPRKFGL